MQQEYFFFNPIYSSLIDKREKIFAKNLETLLGGLKNQGEKSASLNSLMDEKVKLYTQALPSISQTVKYYRNRSRL
jgi:hypothetical protein